MCVIKNPHNFFEPISVMKIVSLSEDGHIVGQFYGSHTFDWYIDRRLAKCLFKPAWFQPSDCRFYYLAKRLHWSHPPFTNALAKEFDFLSSNIVAFGFHLQKDLKLPRKLVRMALDAWRSMTFHPEATGDATYEAEDAESDDLRL